MDDGPWTGLGSLGWFLGLWLVMMGAMMLPSVAPTIALYARMTRTRSLFSPLLFSAGYLVTWGAAGLLAFALARMGGLAAGDRSPGTVPAAGSPVPPFSQRRLTS